MMLGPPTLLSCFMQAPKLLLGPCTLPPIRHVCNAFAQLMLSIPQMFAMLGMPVIWWLRLAVTRRGRSRRLADRDLAEAWHTNLRLRVSYM